MSERDSVCRGSRSRWVSCESFVLTEAERLWSQWCRRGHVSWSRQSSNVSLSLFSLPHSLALSLFWSLTLSLPLHLPLHLIDWQAALNSGHRCWQGEIPAPALAGPGRRAWWKESRGLSTLLSRPISSHPGRVPPNRTCSATLAICRTALYLTPASHISSLSREVIIQGGISSAVCS